MKKGALFIFLWIIYFVSLAILTFDIFIARLSIDLIIFYAVTNAILVYQMFGLYWLTTIVHGLILMAIAVLYVVFNNLNAYVNIIITVTLIAETVFGLFLLMSRYFVSPNQQGIISAVHALIGLTVVGIMFLTVGFTNDRNVICGVLHMIYMLMFMIIILTPQFYGLSKDVLNKCCVAKVTDSN